jgi:adenylate cyclase
MGEQSLKNIARPVRVYRVSLGSGQSSAGGGLLERPALALPDKPSLAVLPFQNMSGDPEQEYFADGMVEEIITALSRVRSFFVIARNSTFTYKGKAVDVKQVGRELGVRYVLEGSVRRAGSRVRITCQLIEAATNHHVWADRFEGTLEDIFDLQDRVTESVVGAIEPKLQSAEIERANLKPTENLAAYDLYLRSLSHLHGFTRGDNDECLRLLYQAISIEPSYTLAKAMIAWCCAQRCTFYWATENDRVEGLRFAREAMVNHRDDPTTLKLAGMTLAYIGRDYEGARAALDRAMALNPTSAPILAINGWIQNYVGDPVVAAESFRRAIRLSPFDPDMMLTLTGLAHSYVRAGRFEEALQTNLEALRKFPIWRGAYEQAIHCFVSLNRHEEARAMAGRLLRLAPDFSIRKCLGTLGTPNEDYRRGYELALRAVGLPE